MPPIVVQLVRADGFREAAAQPEFADEAMIFAAVALRLAGVPARRILAGPLEFAAPIDLTNRHAVIGTTVPGATCGFIAHRSFVAALDGRCPPEPGVPIFKSEPRKRRQAVVAEDRIGNAANRES
jgi:hypothetical protein